MRSSSDWNPTLAKYKPCCLPSQRLEREAAARADLLAPRGSLEWRHLYDEALSHLRQARREFVYVPIAGPVDADGGLGELVEAKAEHETWTFDKRGKLVYDEQGRLVTTKVWETLWLRKIEVPAGPVIVLDASGNERRIAVGPSCKICDKRRAKRDMEQAHQHHRSQR